MNLPTSFPPRIEETPVLAQLIQDPAKAVNATTASSASLGRPRGRLPVAGTLPRV